MARHRSVLSRRNVNKQKIKVEFVKLVKFWKNNLRPAYRAIKRLRGSTGSSANGSVARSDGSLCNTPAEITERWREHYQNPLNHSKNQT